MLRSAAVGPDSRAAAGVVGGVAKRSTRERGSPTARRDDRSPAWAQARRFYNLLVFDTGKDWEQFTAEMDMIVHY